MEDFIKWHKRVRVCEVVKECDDCRYKDICNFYFQCYEQFNDYIKKNKNKS